MRKNLTPDDLSGLLNQPRCAVLATNYADGTAALRAAGDDHPDLVVLDLGLPDLDGVEVIRRLRVWTPVPIVVLSGRADSTDKVEALDAGADDYVTKPFSVPELLARMRVALRRGAQGAEAGDRVLHIEDVAIDLARRMVTRAGLEVHLTPTEYGLLRFLAPECRTGRDAWPALAIGAWQRLRRCHWQPARLHSQSA